MDNRFGRISKQYVVLVSKAVFYEYEHACVPNKGIIAERVMMQRAPVSTQAEFVVALVSGNTIELNADIHLNGTSIGINITGITGLTINGNGFKVDGNNAVGCFLVQGNSEVAFNNITITRGFAVSDSLIQIKLIKHKHTHHSGMMSRRSKVNEKHSNYLFCGWVDGCCVNVGGW